MTVPLQIEGYKFLPTWWRITTPISAFFLGIPYTDIPGIFTLSNLDPGTLDPAFAPYDPMTGEPNPNYDSGGDGFCVIGNGKVDPIVLDLAGEGLQITRLENSTVFVDYNNNGFAQQTAWITAGEGVLVSVPSDGNVTGQNLLTPQSLATMDSNGDGVINANDSTRSKLAVWVENATGTGGQLYTLDQLGIISINLHFTSTGTMDSSGNTQVSIGSFTMQDGSTHQMGDYLINTSTYNTMETDLLTVPDNIKQLPFLPGSGTVYDSWQAMVRDTSGRLDGLIEEFAIADQGLRSVILDHILYQWTGCENIYPLGQGPLIDARRIATLEQFYGQGLEGSWTVTRLNAQYNNIKEYYDGWLMAQTYLTNLFDDITVSYDQDGNPCFNLSAVQNQIQSYLSGNYSHGKLELTEFLNAAKATYLTSLDPIDFQAFCNHFIQQSDDLAEAVYSAGRTVISTNGVYLSSEGGCSSVKDPNAPVTPTTNVTSDRNGNYTMFSDGESDILIGGSGNDNMYAVGGNVVLDAFAPGNDILVGCKGIEEDLWGTGASDGNVTYLWGRNSGNDTICNVASTEYLIQDSNSGQSVVQFGAGITADSLRYEMSGGDLVIVNKTNGHTLTISGWFTGREFQMDKFLFADGTKYTSQQLMNTEELYTYITGSNKSPIALNWYNETFEFESGAINDTAYASSGNNTFNFNSGANNDTAYGGTGNNTFIWGSGSGNDSINAGKSGAHGQDTLQFQNLMLASIEFSKQNNDLVCTFDQTGQSGTVSNWCLGTNYQINTLQFADQTLTAAQVNQKIA